MSHLGAPSTLSPGLGICFTYAAIALVHAVWAMKARHAEIARLHLLDAVLHALLSVAHAVL